MALRSLAVVSISKPESGAAELPDASLGFREAMLVTDPDGHALRIRAAQED